MTVDGALSGTFSRLCVDGCALFCVSSVHTTQPGCNLAAASFILDPSSFLQMFLQAFIHRSIHVSKNN